MRRIAGLIILCMALTTWGQPKDTPKPALPVENKAKGADKPQDKSDAKQPAAVPLPPTINVNVAGKLEMKGQEAQAKRDEAHSSLPEIFTALFTGLLFAVTAWLAGVTTGLLWEAKRQFPWFRKNVEAATQAANAASANVQTLITSERAYVFAEMILNGISNTVMGESEQFGHVQILVKFWNYGKTPAVVTMVRGYIDLRNDVPHELLSGFEGAEKELPPSLGIATNCAYDVLLNTKFSVEDFLDIKHWNKKLYVVGKLEYRTVHDTPCITSFCWHLVYGDVGSTLTLTRDSRLNVRT